MVANDPEIPNLETHRNLVMKSTVRVFDGTHGGIVKREKYFGYENQVVMVLAYNRVGVRGRRTGGERPL